MLPQGLAGLVSPGIGVELADNDALDGGLEGQRNDDSLFVDLPDRLDQSVILAWVLESVKRRGDFIEDAPCNGERTGNRTGAGERNSLRLCRGESVECTSG